MTPAAKSPYAGYRFPGEVISHAVWLYFRFPLSLRMVEEMLAARGIDVSHETVRQWGRKFGQGFANQIRRRLPRAGDKWHLDEVCLMIRGTKHWLWRAVDQDGIVLDVLVQSRRDKRAAQRNAAALLSSSVTRLSVGSTVRSCPLTLAIQLVPWGYRRDAGRSASLGTQSRLVHGICCIERRAVSGQEQYFPCPRSKSTAHDHRSSGPPPLLCGVEGSASNPSTPGGRNGTVTQSAFSRRIQALET